MDRSKFEQMSSEEQARVFHEIPFRERAELLLHASRPEHLTQTLSPEEFYLVSREMDPEERTEIVCYASMPQLFFLSDIDCWKKDRISGRGFVQWLETLYNADEERLLAWLDTMDYEMIVAAFQKITHVLKPEREYAADELLKDRPYFTLDEYYHVFCKEENLETVKRVLETLYEKNHAKYVALLEGCMGELDAEMEEDALRLREMRLAERGFPDMETARMLFTPLTREEFDKYPAKRAASDSKPAGVVPDYPSMWTAERLLLDDALATLRQEPQEIEDGVREELVWLSNKMIACEGIDFASEESVKHGIERVRRLVNIGLEHLSGGDLKTAAQLLKTKWLEIILRWGLTQLFAVRSEANEFIQDRWRDRAAVFYEFAGSPYENTFRGLLKTVPEWHDPEASGSVDLLRDFKTLAEVEEARRRVRQAKTLYDFLERRVPHLFTRRLFQHKKGGVVHTQTSLLGTLYARHLLDGKWSELPLHSDKLGEFFAKAFTQKNGHHLLNADAVRSFMEHDMTPVERETLAPVWADVLRRLELELAESGPERVDARFVSSILIFTKKEKGSK